MKNKQIPNLLVYGVLFAFIFGISLWMLAFHAESPTNWILYVAMGSAVLAALLKFAVYLNRSRQQSA